MLNSTECRKRRVEVASDFNVALPQMTLFDEGDRNGNEKHKLDEAQCKDRVDEVIQRRIVQQTRVTHMRPQMRVRLVCDVLSRLDEKIEGKENISERSNRAEDEEECAHLLDELAKNEAKQSYKQTHPQPEPSPM
jgi:hypothetical protein